MISKGFACGLLILAIALSTGCKTVPAPATAPAPVSEKSEFVSLAESYRQRAMRFEERNEWYMAREFFKVSSQLTPNPNSDNTADDEKTASLTRKIQEESDRFYNVGVAYFEKGKKRRAARAFLEALRINPRHGEAISRLNKLRNGDWKFYRATRETDLATVAEQVYDDPDKSVFIAYFNDLEKSDVVETGRILTIPAIPSGWGRIPAEVEFDIEKKLEKAREHLEAEEYENAVEIAADIRKHDPENAPAAEIENDAWFRIARHYEEYNKYPEAVDAMAHVDPDYEPSQNYMAHLQKVAKELAEQHYKTGVQHFVDEKLENAIIEWEKAVALDPNNQKARQDIENAKSLLEKLGKIK